MGRAIVDISNQRFGKLVAIKRTHFDLQRKKSMWFCRCDCGNISIVSLGDLKWKGTKSCGCLRHISYTKKKEGYAAFNQLYSNYIRQANKRKYTFELTKEQFKSLTNQNCHYCNQKPNQKQQGKDLNGSYTYNGIDRVDNSKGYTLSNCVPCCGACNRAKMDMSQNEFLSWIADIYNNWYT